MNDNVSNARYRMLHEVVNLSSIWIVAIFFNLGLKWTYAFVLFGVLAAVQIISRILLSSFGAKMSRSPLSLSRRVLCWTLIFIINIGCALLASLLPFGLVINYLILSVLTVALTVMLGVWIIRY